MSDLHTLEEMNLTRDSKRRPSRERLPGDAAEATTTTTRSCFGLVALLTCAWLAGCGGSGPDSAGSGGSGGTVGGTGGSSGGTGGNGFPDAGGTGGAGGATPISCNCTATDGCLLVRVLRAANDTALPWNTFPAEADGKGTLIAAATEGAASYRATYPGIADMTLASAAYLIDLGCVTASQSIRVTSFLDDNGDAAATASSSSDYRDACGNPRALTVPVLSGRITLLDFSLVGSCD